MLLGGAGDDVLIGGGGIDVLDGGDGDDIEIQLVDRRHRHLGDRGRQAVAGEHVRIVGGKTVLDVGGEKRTLPRADLSQLVRAAASA